MYHTMIADGVSYKLQKKNTPIYGNISQFFVDSSKLLHNAENPPRLYKRFIFAAPRQAQGNALTASSPGDTPVRLDLEDGGIVCVVELDLWVPQLSRVDVHHDRGGAWGLSRRGHTHYFLAAPPGRAGDEGSKGGQERKRDVRFKGH